MEGSLVRLGLSVKRLTALRGQVSDKQILTLAAEAFTKPA
jgi:hypothetical protein